MSEKLLDPARHEPTDVGSRVIWAGSALLLASVFALALIVLWLYPGATTDRTLRLPLPQYPSPRLQPNPVADMARFYGEEMQWLSGTGWIDKANGIAHIPIADAMRIVAEENIPGWPTPLEKNAPAAQEEVPAAPSAMEKAHEAARPASSSARGAAVRGCSAGSQRHCVRAKARHPTPPPKYVPRRHKSHGAAVRSF